MLRPSTRRVLLTNTDNAETLVDQDRVVCNVVSAPIGATMLDLLAQSYGRRPEFVDILDMNVSAGAGRGSQSRIRDGFERC